MTFAIRLAEIMADRGMNQTDVARGLAITSQSVGSWGKGAKPTFPTGRRLKQLANLLGVTEAQLMDAPGAPFPRRTSSGYAIPPTRVDPDGGKIIEDPLNLLGARIWESLTEDERKTLTDIGNGMLVLRGLPPVR